MLRARLIATTLLAALVIAALPSLAAPPASSKPATDKPTVVADTLKVIGPTGQALALKVADFAALPHTTVKASIHDKQYTFEGVQLTLLLAKVGTPTGQALRGPEVSKVVLVTAADGYKLALSLVETDPRFRANRIIVADKIDGQPLNDHDGPFRLVVEGDLDAARLVRNLATIEVRKLD
jgi:DMSO/TMAO reductase YedYZ molybdopterin-dependent catalytic subunit